MDRFKQFTEANREQFDAFELPLGHTQRMSARLAPRRTPFRRYLAIAVAIAAITAGVVFVTHTPSSPQPQETNLAAIQRDLVFFYTSRFNQLKDSIQSLSPSLPSMLRDDLMKEVTSLENERKLFNNCATTSAISAEENLTVIYTFYSSKIESLEYLLSFANKRQFAKR